YFSRAPIPWDRDAGAPGACRKHMGLYAYRRAFLPVYASLAPTPLEQAEKLDQLRVLEHGHPIAVIEAQASPAGIDTREQYEAFVKRWKPGTAGLLTGPGHGGLQTPMFPRHAALKSGVPG